MFIQFYIKAFIDSTLVYNESYDGVSQGYLTSHLSTATKGIDFEKVIRLTREICERKYEFSESKIDQLMKPSIVS